MQDIRIVNESRRNLLKGGAALTLALYLPYAERRPTVMFIVLTAYPVSTFAAAAAGVVVQLHLRQRPTAPTLAVVGGLAGFGALWMAWNLAFLNNELRAGAGMTLAFSALALLLGWGASRWKPARDTSEGHDRLCEALLRQVAISAPGEPACTDADASANPC